MDDVPFGPSIECGILVKSGTGPGFKHGDVVIAPPEDESPAFLPLFKTIERANQWIDAFASAKMPIEVTAVGSADELTDLLADLKDLGVTHVSIEPRPPDRSTGSTRGATLIPIGSAIIGFELFG